MNDGAEPLRIGPLQPLLERVDANVTALSRSFREVTAGLHELVGHIKAMTALVQRLVDEATEETEPSPVRQMVAILERIEAKQDTLLILVGQEMNDGR